MAYFQLFEREYRPGQLIHVATLELAQGMAAAKLRAMGEQLAVSTGSGVTPVTEYEPKHNHSGIGGIVHCRPYECFGVVGDTAHYDVDGSEWECSECGDTDISDRCGDCERCSECCICNKWYCDRCSEWIDNDSDSYTQCEHCDHCSECCECAYCDNCSERFDVDYQCSNCDRCSDCCECLQCGNCGEYLSDSDSLCEDGYGPCCCDEDCSHVDTPEDNTDVW